MNSTLIRSKSSSKFAGFKRKIMYAIVSISGKQYKIAEGSRTRVPKQVGDSGSTLTFNDVLLIYDGENTHIGEPILPGASVSAEILSHGRDKKILVYKKKRRKGYQIKNGHRQWFTELEVKSIIVPKTKIKSTPSENVSPAIEVDNQEEE